MRERLLYLWNVRGARKHYRKRGYADIPCYNCVIECESQDTDTPWQWILCERCDWGNR